LATSDGSATWQRDFGGDPAIVGRVVPFADNKDVVVIGVLPRGLELPFGRSPGEGTGIGYRIGVQDFWVLGETRPDEYPGGTAIARLRAGVSRQAAQAEVSRLSRQQAVDATRVVQLTTFRDYALGVMRPALPLLEGFAALVLLIACANLANLVLARAAKARGDFAVRAALGARRRDVMRILQSSCSPPCSPRSPPSRSVFSR
jgi:putative ABC transport system permease protein